MSNIIIYIFHSWIYTCFLLVYVIFYYFLPTHNLQMLYMCRRLLRVGILKCAWTQLMRVTMGIVTSSQWLPMNIYNRPGTHYLKCSHYVVCITLACLVFHELIMCYNYIHSMWSVSWKAGEPLVRLVHPFHASIYSNPTHWNTLNDACLHAAFWWHYNTLCIQF